MTEKTLKGSKAYDGLDLYELAAWMITSSVEGQVLEALGRGIMTPADAVGAVIQGVENATRRHREEQDKAQSGH